MAKGLPIFKAGDPEQLQNYRPVSLLPVFSKIYEKIMFQKIMSFLIHKILYINFNMDLGLSTQPYTLLYIY